MDLTVFAENDNGDQFKLLANLAGLENVEELRKHLAKKLANGYSVELLFYNGEELIDSRLLSSCNFDDNSKVYGKKKVIRILIDLSATQSKSKSIPWTTSRTSTTEELIKGLSEKHELPDRDTACLIHNGQYLKAQTRLCDQNIVSGSSLQVISRLRGGHLYY